MKTFYTFLFVALLALQTQISAQNTEGYILNNLGRIVEVATPNGVLPRPHVLIGWDTNGFVKQANSLNTYKIFGNVPSSTDLNTNTNMNGFNQKGVFGSPSVHAAIEIRFGDSSYYWINNSFTGGNISAQKAPFSFYNVGPRSASNPSITGGAKLCFKVVDQDGNSLYTQGEQVIVYGDLSLPADSMYENLGLLPNNPFVSNYRLIYLLRFGQVSVSYTKNSFSIPDDGVLPPSGTVIRFIPQTADTAKPYVEHSIEMDTGSHTHVLNYYSFEKPSFELIQAPPRMEIDTNGVITWTTYPYQMGLVYPGLLKTSNNYGETYKSFTATVKGNFPADSGIVEYKTETAGNRIRFWQRNDGSIGYRRSLEIFGMEYPKGSNHQLLYAGGFLLGGLKSGTENNPDTVNVAQAMFYLKEFQPGRILNYGGLGSLTGENPSYARTFFSLPESLNAWPNEASHSENSMPLQLSGRDTWTVFNDLIDIGTIDDLNSPGFGIEVQRQTFQFSHYPFDNAVLVRYVIINKSNRQYDTCYFGLWNDPDVGNNSGDDLLSVDSLLHLGLTFSDTNSPGPDEPIAFGCLLLQGPKQHATANDTLHQITITNQGFSEIKKAGYKTLMTTSASSAFKNGDVDREYDDACYNELKGLNSDGSAKPGGPYYLMYNYPNGRDSRIMISTGPFNFVAGDTQEVWMAYIGGQGVNNASSIDTVRHYAEWIMNDFKNNQIYKFDQTSPSLSLYGLSTQAVNRVRFIINTNEPLIQASLTTSADTLNLGPMKNGYYADYNIRKTGTINFTLTGKDLGGNIAAVTKTYQISSLNKPAVHGKYTFHPDGQGYLLMSKAEASSIPDKCMLIGEPVEWIATQNNESMKVEFEYSNYDLAKIQSRYEEFDVMNLELYSWDGEQWEPVETSLSSNKLSGFAKGSVMAVFYNPEVNNTPKRFALEPNYPNPFNPSTTIRYQLAQNSKVMLKVYNLLGQEVKTLVNTQQSNGIHSVIWDGTNNFGQRVTSGVYFYRLQAGDFVKTRKMVLVK